MLYLDEDYIEHPKVRAVGAKFGPDGAAKVVMIFLAGLRYSRKFLTDGFLPDAFVNGLTVVSDAQAVVAAMADKTINTRPQWKRVKGGYLIHDFHVWNDKANKIRHLRKQNRERVAKHRARKARRAPTVTPLHEALPMQPVTPDVMALPNSSNGVSNAVTAVTHPVMANISSPQYTDHSTQYTDHDPHRTYAPVPEVLEPVDVRGGENARASVTPLPRSAPLVPSPLSLRGYAYPNDQIGVPTFCHTRYLQRLMNTGLDQAAAELRLLNWYDEVLRTWRGRAIGDPEPKFWDARFAEWLGTTTGQGESVEAHNAREALAYLERQRR